MKFNQKDKQVLAAEVPDDDDPPVSMGGILEDAPGDESVDELENMPNDVLHAEHEALALQHKARQKMAEVRKMRNFYKKEGESRKSTRENASRAMNVDTLPRAAPRSKMALEKGSQVLVTSTVQGKTFRRSG